MNELEARLALSHHFEPGDEVVGAAVGRVGAVQVVAALNAGAGPDVGCALGGPPWDNGEIMRAAEVELQTALRLGVRLIVPGDVQWPTQLGDLRDREPLLLRARGTLPLRLALVKSVAIVGARACTRYGAAVAEELGADLAERGVCVVSGGAFGIDAAAHRGALAGEGPSIAVSAAGVDLPCPRGNALLFDALGRTGSILSEVPIGREPRRHHFLIRNRLIAALTRVVIVVEAGQRSGAGRTANEAIRQGRVLAAVPGPITSAASVGCHQLLREHQAVLIRGVDDVIELLEPIGGVPALESA